MKASSAIENGVQSIGYRDSNYGNSYYYVPHKKNNNTSSLKLRVGEIVSGRIINFIAPEIAKVRLPNGTFTAELHNKLKAGDELYFKIDSVKPNLILKVYSVSSKIKGEYPKAGEYLRILDLPESDIYYVIVEVLAKNKINVIRDEALTLSKSYSYLKEREVENLKYLNVVTTLFWMQEAEIAFNREYFFNLTDFFKELSFLTNLFTELDIELMENNLDLTIPIQNKLRQLKLNQQKFDDLLEFFSLSDTEDSFYNYLSAFGKKVSIGINSKAKKLYELTNKLTLLIESQAFWNMIAIQSNAPFHLFIPLIYKAEFKFAKLIISNRNNKIKIKNGEEIFDLGKFLVTTLNESNFNIELEADSLDKLTHFATLLKSTLTNNSLSLQAFIINEDNNEIDILPEQPKAPTRNFSVVV